MRSVGKVLVSFMASATPDLRLPSRAQRGRRISLTYDWHRIIHMCVCVKRLTQGCYLIAERRGVEPATVESSVRIDKKELGGGQMSKCLKFCTRIEILNRFSLKNKRL